MSLHVMQVTFVGLAFAAAASCVALAFKEPSRAAFQREGDRFARRYRLQVMAEDTARIDAFLVRDRRWRLFTLAVTFVFLATAGIEGFAPEGERDLVATWALLIGISLAAFARGRTERSRTGDDRFAVGDFVHPAVRLVNGVVIVTSGACAVWLFVAPAPHQSVQAPLYAAAPMVVGLIAEVNARMLSTRLRAGSDWIAYVRDSRRVEVMIQLYSVTPLMAVLSLNLALSDRRSFELALAAICGCFVLHLTQQAVLPRARLRFRRTLWPQLAPDEIVSSATP